MDKRVIEGIRSYLLLPDSLADEKIIQEFQGSHIEDKIIFACAVSDLRDELQKGVDHLYANLLLMRSKLCRHLDGMGESDRDEVNFSVVDLSPCPFCGGEDIEHIIYFSEGFRQCKGCGALGPGATPDFDDDASRDAWNKRV